MSLPTIYQTFSGKHVFVTGGSGFLGKVLLYKLLKEFPDIASITLLMRGKKGKQPLERLESDVFSSLCYEGLKKELGPAEWKRRTSKVRVATGDVMNDQLGLNQADLKFLSENVNIIIHLAATVNFQEKLNISVQMNVLGSLRVLALARKCPHLEALVHTSTCYVNYARHGKQLVKEQIYPLPFDPEHMCRLILGLHEKEVPRTTAYLLKKYGFPNTYTFTKNMAETLIQKMKGNIPVTIVRPSIVGCSLREPYPGWVDVLTAAGGIFLTAGLGLTKELHCNPDNIADIVPVDYVVNTLIKVAYKTSVQFKFGTLKLSPIVEASNNTPNGTAVAAPSALVETNLRRIANDPKSAGAVVPSTQTSTSSNKIPSTEATIDSLKVSTYAESTSGIIRPAGTAKVSSASMKQIMDSDAASSGSSDSNGSAVTTSGNTRLPFVFQSATSSSLTPLTWDIARHALCPYFVRYPAPRTIAKPWIDLIENRAMFEAAFFFKRKVPFAIMNSVSKIPGAMSESQKKQVAKLARALYRVNDLNFQFRPFTTVEWRYDAKNSYKFLDEGMDAKTRAAFSTDLYDIDWRNYIESYGYGLVRYFMKVKDARPIPSTPGSSADKFLKSML